LAGFLGDKHTWRSGLNDGKLVDGDQPHQPPMRCPQCRSARVWKDGARQIADRKVQRYLCRDCAFRFSESTQANVKVNVASQLLEVSKPGEDDVDSLVLKPNPSVEGLSDESSLPLSEDVGPHGSSSNSSIIESDINFQPHSSTRQVCVPERGMINLAEVETAVQGKAAGAKLEPSEAEAKILEHAWWMKKQGYKDTTIRSRVRTLKQLVRLRADLQDPESVKAVIACMETSENTKWQISLMYALFASTNHITWTQPSYAFTRKIPFIPLESEIDALIAGSGKKTATILQLIKETGMRVGEARRLIWTDLDLENNTIRVNSPEKGSNPRIFKISSKLIAMLNALPKTSDKLFQTSESSLRVNFMRQRRTIAEKLQNPRLIQITFHTLRHWKATMEYHRTRDILYVKQLLGHKSIENTMRYTQLINFESEEYNSAVAKTLDEARKLVEAGFEYVTDMDGCKLFRKRK